MAKLTDAGTRSYDHYKHNLSAWRFALRNSLIPIIRAETPTLALIQRRCQSQALDSYFALVAHLGTHTFFLIFLPILYWCGNVKLARAMVHMLGLGVFVSGFVKDLLCLPRPMSPPLQRISRTASAALEYGFPSTHSTNAISVALYAVFELFSSRDSMNPQLFQALLFLAAFYTVSISFGRIYCGMHGFSDVIVGTFVGAVLAIVQWVWGEQFDYWQINGPYSTILLPTVIILISIRIHPEPVDDCPCFDDSVAFAGTVIGCQVGAWLYARTPFASNGRYPSSIPFSLHDLGVLRASLRLLGGVLVIFLWRGVAKPTLLKMLPPLFRIIEHLGLSSPRIYFLRATEYEKVPPLQKDDNVIPPASEIPAMITSLRHPRRRAISIGPQSEADAYEAMDFRARRRRLSRSSDQSPSPAALPVDDTAQARPGMPSRSLTSPDTKGLRLGAEIGATANVPPLSINDESIEEEDAKEDLEMFRRLQKPRVRYDVEVVTKLIVYTGIGWLAVAGVPFLFEYTGLGVHR